MNSIRCCHSKSPRRRITKTSGAVLSAITLILMPKCPMCVAAYVALFTGISLSTPAATHLRTAVVTLCIGTLAFFLLTGLRRISNGSNAGRRGTTQSP